MLDDPKKKRVLEAIQAVMLMCETSLEYADAALRAATEGRTDDAAYYMGMVDTTLNAEVTPVVGLIRGEPVN